MRRRWTLLITALVAMLLVLASCTGNAHPARQSSGGTKAGDTKAQPAPALVPVSLAVSPAAATRGAPVTTEIGTAVTGGAVAGVRLVDSAGVAVAGSMRPDGTSWVPAAELAYGRSYTATVTAVGAGGQTRRASTTFTTMANPGRSRIGTGLYLQPGTVYGVGMPVVVEFDEAIPDAAKASVERRLFVTSSPAQVGVWHWYGDRQVLYRPKMYWQPGTVLTVRAALGGLPVGGRYIDVDRGASVTIGANQTMLVDNASKTLSVYRAGALVRTFPVSLGKPDTPTSSGSYVLMSRDYTARFKTSEYDIVAYYDERFTWDGQYLHAAPWSVDQQGSDNVSHGCVNLSMDAARWIYENSRIGDPLTVQGTEVHGTPGDGWMVWDLSWPDYVAGSALPHPELLDGTGGAVSQGGARYPTPQ